MATKHEEELQAYLNAGGYICPRCKEYTCEAIMAPHVDEMGATQEIHCINPKCKHKWTDIYQLIDFKEDDDEDQLDGSTPKTQDLVPA
jgi:hypothetical protein